LVFTNFYSQGDFAWEVGRGGFRLGEERGVRAVKSALPASMWFVMILGAVLTIAMCWLFDMTFVTHLVLGGILAAYLGTMMYLIIDMNQPFRGDVSISAEPFETLYQRMDDE
jgi:hypothetical protein